MKKLSTNAKRLIALPVLFIVYAVFLYINGNDEGPLMIPALIFLFAFLADLLYLIYQGFKKIKTTLTKKHTNIKKRENIQKKVRS